MSKKGWGYAQVLGNLPSKTEALSSNSSNIKEKKNPGQESLGQI
jgi:hypothetical protein